MHSLACRRSSRPQTRQPWKTRRQVRRASKGPSVEHLGSTGTNCPRQAGSASAAGTFGSGTRSVRRPAGQPHAPLQVRDAPWAVTPVHLQAAQSQNASPSTAIAASLAACASNCRHYLPQGTCRVNRSGQDWTAPSMSSPTPYSVLCTILYCTYLLRRYRLLGKFDCACACACTCLPGVGLGQAHTCARLPRGPPGCPGLRSFPGPGKSGAGSQCSNLGIKHCASCPPAPLGHPGRACRPCSQHQSPAALYTTRHLIISKR